jgi:dihydroflavonol-4-reductase
MRSTIFVTGATGQTGGNVCEQLIQRGDQVRALVRNPDEASALSDIGVELVKGDIRDGDDVLRAAKGAEAAIHCAALLGGASQDLEDFKAVNMVGTANVLDAGKAHGMRRVVALSTATFLNLSTGVDFEEAPVLDNPPKDPYTVTKLAAFQEAHRRAAPVVERALHRTSFNRVLLAGMRGKIKRYLAFPVTWVAGKDVATGSIAALDRGVAGERYLLVGRPQESFSTAGGINRACEIAGIDHRVEDLDYRTDPEALTAEFGPTLMAIAKAAAKSERMVRTNDNLTARRLGYEPISFDDGLRLLISWLRGLGRLDPVAA